MIVTRCLPMGIICNLWFEKYIPLLHKSDDYHHRHQLLEYFREWDFDFFLCTTGYMNTLLVCLFSLSNVICNFRGWPRKWKTRLLSSLIQQHDMTYTQTCFMFVLLVLALIFFRHRHHHLMKPCFQNNNAMLQYKAYICFRYHFKLVV